MHRFFLEFVLPALLLSCNGFVGEVDVTRRERAITIVNPDYLILRPIMETAGPGLSPATIHTRTVFFNPADRIVDLRHFDPRTARVESTPANSFVVSIRTTAEGSKILGAWTSENIDQRLGVFVENRLISDPQIKSRIDAMIILDGDYSKAQAEEIVARLRRGGAAAM